MQPYTEKDYKGMYNLLTMEKYTIKHYLDKKHLSKSKISKVLGISEATLNSRISKHNLV